MTIKPEDKYIYSDWGAIPLPADYQMDLELEYKTEVYKTESQLFAVWEREDLLKLAEIVQAALEVTEL